MKKLFSALLAFLLIASFPALSQKGLYFGLAGTIQSTWITNQNNYGLSEMDYKSTFGGAGNLNIGYDFTNHLGLKLEIGYSKFGQKYTDSKTDSLQNKYDFAREIKMNYLTIPILFKYRTGGTIAKFFVAVGPQINMLLSAKQTYTVNGAPFVANIKTASGSTFDVGKEDIKERYSSMDLVARVDLGVEITLVKFLMLDIGATFNYGLMDLNATDYRLKDSTGNYHPSHAVYGGLNLGLNFRL